jgi:hypothetical protein
MQLAVTKQLADVIALLVPCEETEPSDLPGAVLGIGCKGLNESRVGCPKSLEGG